MPGFGPVGSHPVGGLPLNLQPSVEDTVERFRSADWTGIEERLAANPAAVAKVSDLIGKLNNELASVGLTNAELARAMALTGALSELVKSPDPEWEIIGKCLVRLAEFFDSLPVRAGLNFVNVMGLAIGAFHLLF